MATKVAPVQTQEFVVLTTNWLTFDEMAEKAAAKGLVVASNQQLDRQLQSGEWEKNKEAFPCWAGTIGAYAEPGKKLGKEVEYTDPKIKRVWVFPVPEKWQNETNVMLKVEHPHWKVEEDGNRRIIRVDDETNISLINDFPTMDGWYKTKDGIPCGEKSDDSDPDARYLHRADQRVVPVVRDLDGISGSFGFGASYVRRSVHVYLNHGPFSCFRALAVQTGEAGTPEKLAAERKDDGTLVLTGSKEEIDAIVKQLNLG